MTVDVTFEDQPWDLLLGTLKDGSCLSASQLLAELEGASEDQAEEVLQSLIERHIRLDIRDLPKLPADDAAALRLKQEEKLAQQQDMRSGLDQNDPLRLYLEEIADLPAAGDPAVLACSLDKPGVCEQLVNAMLSRAVSAARDYVGHGVLLLDLIQEASLGLWQGISCYVSGDIYDHCDWWIHQYLAGAVARQARSVGVGQKLRQAMEDYRSVDDRLLAELGRNPTPEEIGQAMHISALEAQTVADMVSNARKLNRVRSPEPEQLPQEEDQAVEDTAYFQMRQRIQELLSGLSEQDAQLLTLRYGLEGGLPQEPSQVALKLGITPQEVINREAAALSKLRQQ